MKKNDLCNQLRQLYKPGNPSGTAKTADPKYKNLWFVVPPAPPELPPKNLPIAALSKANKALNQLPQIGSETDLDSFIALLFQRREALTSSRMEGTWSTIDHVLTPSAILDDSTENSATASIRGYAEALEKNFSNVIKKKHRALSTNFVKSLHKTITSKDPSFDGTPGAIRQPGGYKSVVFIGGLRNENSYYNPAPPEHVERCFKEVMNWYQNDLLAESGDAGINAFSLPLRIAIGHSHFEAVHPFQDGNGRAGRMLWPFQMVLANYSPLYLSGFVEAEKSEYGIALGEAQQKLNYIPIIEFICEAISQSFVETKKTKSALLMLPQEWQQRAKFRKSSAALRALPYLIRSPILSANELSQILDISFQAASTALNSLVDRKILKERTGYGRNRIFSAEEVLSIIGRPHDQDPEIKLSKVRKQLLTK